QPGAAASAPLEFRANEVVQPQRASLPERIAFSGPLVAPNTVLLRARTSGTLLALTVAEGDRVKAGQVLGRIDMAELAPRIAERSAMLDSARASLAQAERTHASNERLAAQNFISPNALDSSRAQVDTARAALAAAQATLDTTRVGQRDATLLAPIAGIVAKRHVLPGEKVSAEQQVLTIVDLARLELAGSVGTHEVARLTPGMPVQVRVEGMDAALTGQLARIAPAAEAGTRSIGVTVALANAQERLRAGQYAIGEVQLPDDRQRLLLPAAAVGSTAGQNHVWVIEGGKLARRAVTLGRRDEAGARVEVLDGIGADAKVLGARFDNLREGALARVTGRSPAGAATGPAVASAAAAASAPAQR
ncbi:efflux RND transporter periplasmic adaptor subunit, partial [Pseudorhodoferax sp.]|uniref:efflux RND transporter periplasmic adaptor subunit n=1 Tax=Pseudorhodoferax sp. TaxID=1993553 RepID=UPI002DD6B05B